jgi:hypothetical protein
MLEKTICEKNIADKTIEVPVPIPYNRLLDLMTSALEGGSNYWIHFVHAANGEDWEKLPLGKFEYVQEVPFLGGTLYIQPNEDPGKTKIQPVLLTTHDDREVQAWRLNLEDILTGIVTMSKLKKGEGGHHWPNFLNERDDAETGDVFLQCCVFGEIIFG